MKKKLALLTMAAVMSFGLFGCASDAPAEDAPAVDEGNAEGEGGYKTGIAIVADPMESKDATAEEDGLARVDNTVVAVVVDENGVIVNCAVDNAQVKINFSTDGKIVTPLDTTFMTKAEQGDDYGMRSASTIGKEWNEQAEAFAQYVIGKTKDEVLGIAVEESKATDEDLMASVTVAIGDMKAAVAKAIDTAVVTGASATDKLGIGANVTISKSKDATAEAEGLAQSYATFTAATFDENGVITSSVIDALQGNINFDATGKITTDLAATMMSKNELGDDYGMRGSSGIGKEWNEQAASFAAYVVGKTVDEVKGIALEEGAPADEDLAATVTVSVGGFQEGVEKAASSAR